MRTLIIIAFAGAAAQLIDGGIGMGFGATSTTLLILLAGIGPGQASAVVHTAEVGTTLISGMSHWRFGNVDWSVVLRLGVPGAAGAFAGATVLSQLSTQAAAPVTSAVLACIGCNLVWRVARGSLRRVHAPKAYARGSLPILGLVGGFIDATGGGGWGPVTTSTLLTLGRQSPRTIVGTVNTAEFLVSLAATLGFAAGMWHEITQHFGMVLALLLGGAITTPIAAWLVSTVSPLALTGIVGSGLVALHLPKVFPMVSVPWWGQLAIFALGAACTVVASRKRRAEPKAPQRGSTSVVASQEPVGPVYQPECQSTSASAC